MCPELGKGKQEIGVATEWMRLLYSLLYEWLQLLGSSKGRALPLEAPVQHSAIFQLQALLQGYVILAGGRLVSSSSHRDGCYRMLFLIRRWNRSHLFPAFDLKA